MDLHHLLLAGLPAHSGLPPRADIPGPEGDPTGMTGTAQAGHWDWPKSSLAECLKVYLMGVVRGLSLVSRTKTASSFAGSVLLALRLIAWVAPGGSDQLSPA